MKSPIIAVLGLGYVGLPLALSFAKKYPGTIGFDINSEKVKALKSAIDTTQEGHAEELKKTSLLITHAIEDLKTANFFIVGVPTPVDENKTPDLKPLESACHVLSKVLKKGDTVVFESTVYPGVTEEFCGPLLEKITGLKQATEFYLGYSPERMNPGDKDHTFETIVKVVSGQDAATLELVAEVYGSVVKAGVYKATSIKVAEAAKVIENTQRDLNIALMNELSIIFDALKIRTKDVLDAAGTKWNFLKFNPGLVGGHCIGVDPYYLTAKAQQLGYTPQVILAGRRINDGMGAYIAQRLVKLLVQQGSTVKGSRVAVLGLTFKENVSDLRNSRVPDIVKELKEFGVTVLVHDPKINSADAEHEYGLSLVPLNDLNNLDAIIYAVPHREFQEKGVAELLAGLKPHGIVIDVKSALKPEEIKNKFTYWSL